ncbi:hypothetical protein CSUI_000800 [Cystoisospora suis]|uniref:Uncharacterized protein n=1 Tax=Cystoisospora suis TaxID=483139 RepID=A0A2C6KMV9_9APIC|nr:hypothetical protein CSUI_000800 [Cystoisospora suis]
MGERGLSDVDSTEEDSEQDSAIAQVVASDGRHQSCGSQDYRPTGPVAPRGQRDTGCKTKKSILRFRGLRREMSSGASEIFSSPAVCCLVRGRQSAEDPFSYDPPWRFRWQCTEAWKLRDLSKKESPTSGLFETWGHLGKAEIRLCAVRSEPDVSSGVPDKGKAGKDSPLGVASRHSASLPPPERRQLKGRKSSEARRNNGGNDKTACATSECVPFGVFLVFHAAVRADFTIQIVRPYSEDCRGERVREECSSSLSQTIRLTKEAGTPRADGCATQRQAKKSTSSEHAIKGQRRTANEETEPERQRADRKKRTTKEEGEVLKESERLQCEYSGRRNHWHGISNFGALDATADKKNDVLFIDVLIHRAVPLSQTSQKVDSGATCEFSRIRARQGTNMTLSTSASTTSLATVASRSSRRFTGGARSVERRLQLGNTMEQLREEAPSDTSETEWRQSVVETFSKPPGGRTRRGQIVKQRTRAIHEDEDADSDSHTTTPPARSPTMGEPPIRLFRQSVKNATNPENAYPTRRDGRPAEHERGKEASATGPTTKGRKRRVRASKKKSHVGSGGEGTRGDAMPRDPEHPRKTAERGSSAAAQSSVGVEPAASPKAAQSRPAVVRCRRAAENAALQSGQVSSQNAGKKDPPSNGSQRARGRKSRRNALAKKSHAAECAEGGRKSAATGRDARVASARGAPLCSGRKQTKAVKTRSEAFTEPGNRDSIVRKIAANDSRQLEVERGGAARGLVIDSRCSQGDDPEALGFDAVERAALVRLIRSVLSAVAPACPSPNAPRRGSSAFCSGEGGASHAGRTTFPEYRPVPECDALPGRKGSDFRSFPQSSTSSCPPFHNGPSLGTGYTTMPSDAMRACRIALECLLKHPQTADQGTLTGQPSFHPISAAENRDRLHLADEQSGRRPVSFASLPGFSRLPHSASIVNDKPILGDSVMRGVGERNPQSAGAQLGSSDCTVRPGFVAEYAAQRRLHSEPPDTVGPAAATHILGTAATHPTYSARALEDPHGQCIGQPLLGMAESGAAGGDPGSNDSLAWGQGASAWANDSVELSALRDLLSVLSRGGCGGGSSNRKQEHTSSDNRRYERRTSSPLHKHIGVDGDTTTRSVIDSVTTLSRNTPFGTANSDIIADGGLLSGLLQHTNLGGVSSSTALASAPPHTDALPCAPGRHGFSIRKHRKARGCCKDRVERASQLRRSRLFILTRRPSTGKPTDTRKGEMQTEEAFLAIRGGCKEGSW